MRTRTLCNGVPHHYLVLGRGPAVVLIHGLAANLAFWPLLVTRRLAQAYRVVLYDLRGHGYSGMPESGYTSAILADDLMQLLDQLALAEAHLIGHSFGGVVALHAAILHPERVASVAVVDSRVRALQPAAPGSHAHGPRPLSTMDLVVPDDETEPGLWLLEHFAVAHLKDGRGGADRAQAPPVEQWGGAKAAATWLTLLRQTSVRREVVTEAGLTRDRLAGIARPVLAMYGADSPTRPSLEALRGCIPHLTSVVVPTAGHFFVRTRPIYFVEAVEGFLGRCTEAPRTDGARPAGTKGGGPRLPAAPDREAFPHD